MEKRLNTKIESYITGFKNDIRNKAIELNKEPNNDNMNLLIEYVYDYNRLIIDKEDLNKRKRVKNSIPCENRCLAKRANNEQCTRRRKNCSDFCGTHSKGTPHGLIDSNIECNSKNKVIEVYAQEISGIVYYLDNYNNVYKTEDIMLNKENPEIIGKYEKNSNEYTIPNLGLH
jgi:hypothetical protein